MCSGVESETHIGDTGTRSPRAAPEPHVPCVLSSVPPPSPSSIPFATQQDRTDLVPSLGGTVVLVDVVFVDVVLVDVVLVDVDLVDVVLVDVVLVDVDLVDVVLVDVDHFHTALLSSLVGRDSKRVTSCLQRVWNIHRNGVHTALFGRYMAGATSNCCRVGAVCVHHTTITPCHVASCKAT